MNRTTIWALIVCALVIILLGGSAAPEAEARPNWRSTEASWYGPGFYGNRFACAGTPGLPVTYRRNTRGVAHRTLPCGTSVVICWRRPGARRYTCVRVRVIDRGPYVAGRNLDLTARTAMDLICGPRQYCAPFTLKRVIYHA
jgi:rare lipoprotein A (peptidoglycan hydrolase)